jgi:ribosomal subunit interface protein
VQFDLKGVDIVLSDEIATHATDRLGAALNQYKTHVRAVIVRLKDLNGPKGGVDKECDVEVKLFPAGSITVKEANADLYTAISLVADRVKTAVGRKIDRQNNKRS